MTLQEAIKSGKRFKRAGGEYFYSNGKYLLDMEDINALHGTLNLEDILADDWEIEEEKLELTAGQIREVLMESRLHVQRFLSPDSSVRLDIDTIIKRLGFKE